MDQLSGLDAMFIHAEMHGLPMHISSLSIYDPSTSVNPLEFRQIVDLFEKKVQRNVPILRSKLVKVPFNLDQPYWMEDPNFDLVYHVRHIALPKPGTWQKLCALAANLHAQPLNRDRPLWEAYIIDGLDHIEDIPKGSFAIFLKVHHAILDGRTGMEIYKNLHTLSPEPYCELETDHPAHEQGQAIEHQSDITMATVLARAAGHGVGKTTSIVKLLGKSFSVYGQLALAFRNKELKQLHKPRTRFNGVISPRRVVDRIRLPMVDIKAIKSMFAHETVNDVALTIISGALRRYLIAKDELPEDSLVAAIPIDVRDSNDEHIKGNRISITNMSLRTDIADPMERLRAVHQEAVAGKAYADTLGKNIVCDVLDNIYPALVSWGVKAAVESGWLDKFPPANNTVITNVHGASVPLYLCGARLIDSFGMGPLIPNTGLFHTISSTYDFLTIAFTADRMKMADPDFYVQCLEESFVEIIDAIKTEQEIRLAAASLLPEDQVPVKKARRRSGSNRIKPSSTPAEKNVTVVRSNETPVIQ
ncbi:MAG TPA: wax ester/triacylglycerol synthase family O-acyltransferase [Pseudomonadales bacterium]|nr:wax ester/triacylglycerol synthase family O-acyltransferase [Pseudomonadales bacterium]